MRFELLSLVVLIFVLDIAAILNFWLDTRGDYFAGAITQLHLVTSMRLLEIIHKRYVKAKGEAEQRRIDQGLDSDPSKSNLIL